MDPMERLWLLMAHPDFRSLHHHPPDETSNVQRWVIRFAPESGLPEVYGPFLFAVLKAYQILFERKE